MWTGGQILTKTASAQHFGIGRQNLQFRNDSDPNFLEACLPHPNDVKAGAPLRYPGLRPGLP